MLKIHIQQQDCKLAETIGNLRYINVIMKSKITKGKTPNSRDWMIKLIVWFGYFQTKHH